MSPPRTLRVGIVGCGLVGRKRAAALPADTRLEGCFDVDPAAAGRLAKEFGCRAYPDLAALLDQGLDVVIVATVPGELAAAAVAGLRRGAHVLVEKPAGRSSADVERIQAEAQRAGRLVKVGFNHRFHPGVNRAVHEALSGRYGDVMYVRGRYGHGGRPGYEREWRADPGVSGGGEMVDQGMHLLDLSYWLLGPLPVGAGLTRTHFWEAPVEDNAVLILGGRGGTGDHSPWALFHVSWTEWKNTFSLEIYCRTAKLAVEGLGGSYGPETLYLHRMRPEMGPPDTEVVRYPDGDVSWELEWAHMAAALRTGEGPLLGDLESARYAWRCVEAARA